MIRYILVVMVILAAACSTDKLPEKKSEAPVVKAETKDATPVAKVEAPMTKDATKVAKETKDATPIKK